MQTFSHLLLTAALRTRLRAPRALPPVRGRALLVGSVLPDVPLWLLTVGYLTSRGLDPGQQPGTHPFGEAYDTLYFTHPLWISGHNLLHGPLLVATYALVGHLMWGRGRGWGATLFWLAVAAGFHTGVDILTHHNDGPLLLFPFDWQTRFHSPVSYWDPAHYGRLFGTFELLLDATIAGWMLVRWQRGRNPT